MILPRLLKRNRFGFRLRRRSVSNRFFQLLVVIIVLFLFIYFLLYALSLNDEIVPPDYTWLKTRNMSAFVRPLDHDTTILEPSPNPCPPEDKLRLVVMVTSSPENPERRSVIRKTWAKELLTFPGVRVFFNLGTSSAPYVQERIVQEHRDNNDLIQQDFVDHYMNLTLKTTMMLKWLDSNDCRSSKFVLKTDDDVFINPTILWDNLEHALLHTTTTKSLASYLPSSEDNQAEMKGSESIDYLLMGFVHNGVPIRDIRNKWYLPLKFYPLNIFPKFLSGIGYVFSTSVLPMLYQCALKTPYMNLEDVFITGLCGTTQLGLKATHNPTFRFRKPFVGPNYVCYYKFSSMIHPLESDEMEAMTEKIKEEHNCDTFYFSFIQAINHVCFFVKNLLRI